MQKVNTAGYQTDCFVGEKAVASQLRKRTLCSTVTNFNNGSEASCGSDTKDELHIVEDDSLQEPEVTKADGTTPEDSHDATTTVLPHNGSLNRVKDTLVEEILQQGDTAIIYPEAPEDEQSPAETGGADENGTPDSFSQLLTCPYCSRIFKHKASLKVHIKYRHETSEDNYSCPHCSYTYYHRWKLERHMMRHHRGTREQVTSKLKGINSVKGFISPPTTQTTPVVIAPTRVILKEKTESKPLQEQLPVTQIKSEPVEYECKPVTAAPATSAGTNGVVNGGTAQPAGVPAATLPQGVAMVVPTVGLMSPISINLNDLQNVLKVAMDGNILRQVLGTANGVVTQGKQGIVVQQPQQQIISLPAFVDHDGTTKIIINYSISPAAATTATTQPAPLVAKNNPPLPPTVTTAADPTPTDRTPTPEAADLTIVKAEPESVPIMETEAVTQTESVKTSDAQTAQMPKVSSTSTCLLCDDCPDNLEALHLLQHRKAANGEAVDSAALDPSFAALLNEAGVTLEEPPVDDLLSLLKTYFASNANPSEAELTKISESVSIPVDVVRKWFAKMNSGKNVGKCRKKAVSKKTETTNSSSKNTSNQNGEAVEDSIKDTSNKASSESGSASPSDCSPLSPNTEDLIIVKSEPDDPEASDSQAEPLDLSLPKHIAAALKTITTPPAKQQEQPLNLTCLRKEQLEGRTIYVTTPQTGRSVNIVTAAQLPTLVAIAGQGTMSCLSAINTTTKRTILIPQLTYTYATTAGNATGAKTVVLNGHKETRLDSNSDGVSTVEEQNDSDSASLIKKRRLENGVYPCDLCSKVFQKGSSLLRHKYEHTGKRPHECNTCKKAFKHKHHLIEHSRLHSGEKPYQCDKCGKRFSHSGSYSQHMNHRYSYCKKDGPNSGSGSGPRRAQSELGSPGPGPHSDSRTTTPPSQLDSDERESEEEEDEDDEAMCMDDIRVVQVDDGECEIYEGNFDDDDEDGEEVVEEETTGEGEAVSEKVDDEVVCDVLEVELGDDHMEDDEIEETTEEKEDGEMEETTEEKEDREMEETTEEKEDREIGETAEEKEDGEMEETTEEKEDGEIGETAEEKEDGEMEETTEEKEDEEMEETTEEKEDEEIRETNEEKEDEEIGETTEEKEDEEIGETNEEKEDEEIGETTEEKEEAANVDTEGVADCEENTDKCIREGSDSTEPTEEVMTNAK